MSNTAKKTEPTLAVKSLETLSAEPTAEDDIDQIMSEIENLQQEMGAIEKPKLRAVTGNEDAMKEFHGEGENSDGGMEETLGSTPVDETPENSILNEIDEEETMLNDHEDENNGSLTMNLTGNMTLKLNYEVDGQEVSVSFVDHTMKVTLADGTEFKIPLNRKTSKRAA